ncbi:hypothetical protein B0H17DRAFT_1193179 [Mycena rosella]|uniref:FAD linked oxidase N-terminal domain-containing protein n=1 Tax=Mycena rosella TaxID=1033263 RepID=A0AAD7M8D5_MYCRO|nr:hypothetical protein B0H17DRAFT_1193179 [Mycena rosella]
MISLAVFVLCVFFGTSGKAEGNPTIKSPACRNIPGSAGYPSPVTWDELNATIYGLLVNVVPSAKYCVSLPSGACTDAQWTSALFRSGIPGAMDQVNWEQGYDLMPPSLCLRNTTVCGQGDVLIYSVEAETVADIQAAVKFASTYNLRLAVKSSGHDYLGRSTAPYSLLIRTTNFKNISFTNDEVTMGSGVFSQTLIQRTKESGKIVLTALAATTCTAGEFQVVVANGELLQVNSISHADLFYALRGGRSGSWGVIVSTTFRTFPTFNVTSSIILSSAANNIAAGALATIHAQHIFDMDPTMALLAPFLNASLALPNAVLLSQDYAYGNINDAMLQADDSVGINLVLGPRLISAAMYRDSPAKVGQVYKALLNSKLHPMCL